MRKVILYMAMSLDGYTADKNGGVRWLAGDGTSPESPGSYDAFIQSVDTVIMGYTTYHQIVSELSPGQWVYPGRTSYVLTHKKIPSQNEIIFTDQEPDDLINRLKQEDGKDIWICGGASVANQLMTADLIDRYWITVIPTILGGGVPLFAPREHEIRLQLICSHSDNGMTDLVYERR